MTSPDKLCKKLGELYVFYAKADDRLGTLKGDPCDVSFWNAPDVRSDTKRFFRLATMWYPHLDNWSPGRTEADGVDGRESMIQVFVADATEQGNPRPPLAAPLDYTKLFDTRHISDDGNDGSCWRATPPDGYVALGDVYVRQFDAKPSKDLIRCVREDLTAVAKIGDLLWAFPPSWGIPVPRVFPLVIPEQKERNSIYIAPGSFFSIHDTAIGTEEKIKVAANIPVARVLKLPTLVETLGATPEPPPLTSRAMPVALTTPETVERITYVPYAAVADPGRDLKSKLTSSQFYRIERRGLWRVAREKFVNNSSDSPMTINLQVASGIAGSNSKTVTRKTSMEISAESGVKIGPVSAKVSVKFGEEMGWEETQMSSWFKNETESIQYDVLPHHAICPWVFVQRIYIVRDDGTLADDVPIEIVESKIPTVTQYPLEPTNQVKVNFATSS